MIDVQPSRLLPRWWFVAALVLVGTVLGGLSIGPVPLTVSDIWAVLVGHLPGVTRSESVSLAHEAIIWDIRFPRVMLGVLVGGTLAMSGAAYQGVFRNPLADPYLLGVAAGAGLGATLAIAIGGAGSALLPVAAFVGAIAAAAITYAIGSASSRTSSVASLILSGVAVAAFLTAAQTYVQQRNSETLREVYSWILGRLSTAGWSDVRSVLPYVVIASVTLFALRRMLDVLALGDEEATALGMPVTRIRLIIVAAATLGTAAVVAVSGLIGFVGIVIPHLLRLMFGSSYRLLIPLSFLGGGAFLVAADLFARIAIPPAELPIGVITAFLGAPFFALILRTRQGAVR